MERRRNEADGRGGEGGNGVYMYAWIIRRQEVYQREQLLQGKIILQIGSNFLLLNTYIHELRQNQV